MDLIMAFVLSGVGLGLILFFAEQLVKGAVGTSVGFGVSAFLISVVFIGFDPENLAVGAVAAAEGVAGIALVEVNYRYTEMYFGAIEGNWDYALYTAEKIGLAIENGLERRPLRRPNAEAIFLKGSYPAMLEALQQRNPTLFKERFDVLRSACNTCHIAEGVPFIRVGIPTIKHTALVHH